MIVLPVLAYAGIERLFAQLQPELDLRHRCLRAGVVWGLVVVGFSELLSLGHAITQPNLALAWLVTALAAWTAAVLRARQTGVRLAPDVRLPASPIARFFLVALVLILGVSAVVAWLAPPQTWDSLNYHMSRVAHWAQARSVGYFATGIENQNSRPPMAEMAVLHLYVLAQGDRFSNFIAWSALLGCVLGAGAIAGRLGAKPIGQWFSALFVATLPMALAQASSTMNDLVVAMWMACAALELLVLAQAGWGTTSVVFLSLAAGLATLTKPTALPYLLPFALAAGWILIRRAGAGKTARAAGIALVLVLVVNAGYLARSFTTYGGPFESGETAIHLNQVRDVRGVVSNVLRNASLHLGTPNPYVNKAMYLGLDAIHRWIGLDISDPRTTAHGDFEINAPTTIETRAGNPLQMLAGIGTLCVLAIRRKRYDAIVFGYALVVLGTFLALSWLLQWQVFGSRYHLPFFVLLAPLAGVVLADVIRQPWIVVASLLLAVGALPCLVSLRPRPLLALGEDSAPGILQTPRQELYFSGAKYLEDPYTKMVDAIRSVGCQQVGLALGGNGAEYPLWAMLGAPRSGVRLEWLVGGTPSARYAAQDFVPCAVVCQSCPTSWDQVRGLVAVYHSGKYRLFLEP
jgi:hypothetical protein